MKRILLSSIMLLAFAGITRAQVFLGGSANFGYTYEDLNIKVSPVIGYEFNNKWAVGAGVGFGYSNGDFYGWHLLLYV